MTTYERYRKNALHKYKYGCGPSVDEMAYNVTIAKRFHKVTEEEYNDIMHICMACTIPFFEYDETTKEGIEYLSDGSTLRFPATKL